MFVRFEFIRKVAGLLAPHPRVGATAWPPSTPLHRAAPWTRRKHSGSMAGKHRHSPQGLRKVGGKDCITFLACTRAMCRACRHLFRPGSVSTLTSKWSELPSAHSEAMSGAFPRGSRPACRQAGSVRKGVLGVSPKSRGIERGFGRNPVAESGAAPRGLGFDLS